MIPQTNWLERTWEFNFPAGHYPCILERFRGTPARIEEFVRACTPGILTIRINKAWSIQEHIGHLLDLSDLDDRRFDDYLSGAELLTAADMKNEKTSQANHNAHPIQEILRNFRRRREGLVHKLEAVTDEQVVRTALHPRLKKQLRLVDWVYFMAEHDDHHIARITVLARTLQQNR